MPEDYRPVYHQSSRVGTGFWAHFWDFFSLVTRSYSRQIRRLPFKPLFYFALGCGCAMAMFALIQNARSRRNQYPFMIKGMRLNQGHPFMVRTEAPESQRSETQQKPQSATSKSKSKSRTRT